MLLVSYDQTHQAWRLRVGDLSLGFDSAVVTPQGKFEGEGFVGFRVIHGLAAEGANLSPGQLRKLGVGQGKVDRRFAHAVHLHSDGTWERYSV